MSRVTKSAQNFTTVEAPPQRSSLPFHTPIDALLKSKPLTINDRLMIINPRLFGTSFASGLLATLSSFLAAAQTNPAVPPEGDLSTPREGRTSQPGLGVYARGGACGAVFLSRYRLSRTCREDVGWLPANVAV